MITKSMYTFKSLLVLITNIHYNITLKLNRIDQR